MARLAHVERTVGHHRPGPLPRVPGVAEYDEMLWSPESLTEFAARQPKLGHFFQNPRDDSVDHRKHW